MRDEISLSERRSSPFTVLCKPTGTWNVQTHERTLESPEKSYTVSEDTLDDGFKNTDVKNR